MAIQDPLTELIIGCCFRVANEADLLVNFGRAKIQIRRLGMTRAAATGDVDLDVKDVQ